MMADVDPQAYVKAWDDHRLKLRAKLIDAGLDEELADAAATTQVRHQIERSPPLAHPPEER